MSKVVIASKANDYRQDITAGSHKIASDAPPSVGGKGTAPDPHELLLSSLGACTAMTMQMYAQKRNINLESVNIELEEKKVDDPNQPGKQMSKIERHIHVKGDMTQEQLDGLKAIADKCPIHKLITGQKEINTTLNKA